MQCTSVPFKLGSSSWVTRSIEYISIHLKGLFYVDLSLRNTFLSSGAVSPKKTCTTMTIPFARVPREFSNYNAQRLRYLFNINYNFPQCVCTLNGVFDMDSMLGVMWQGGYTGLHTVCSRLHVHMYSHLLVCGVWHQGDHSSRARHAIPLSPSSQTTLFTTTPPVIPTPYKDDTPPKYADYLLSPASTPFSPYYKSHAA